MDTVNINAADNGAVPAVQEADTKGNRESRIILISALAASLLFCICFRGAERTASLSSLVFFNAMSAGLFFVMRRLGILVKKRAFVLAVPIFILSVFNAYFEYSYYNIFNCIGFYILFASMTLWAADMDPKADIESFLSLMFSNFVKGTAFAAGSARGSDLSGIRKAALGVCFSLPVFIVIASLLVSADKAFSDTFMSLAVFRLDFGSILWSAILFACVAVYLCGYIFCLLTRRRSVVFNLSGVDNTVAVSFLTPVNLLFVFFCVSQLKYLAGGLGLPEFTTYSQYAREGFFQLLFVTFINFTIVLVFTEVFKSTGSRQLKGSLVLLCIFTLVLIISSFYRMYLYISTYSFTPLRIEVLTFLAAETVLVFITIAAVLKNRCNIISRFVFFGILSLMVLNVIARPEVSARLNPDYLKTLVRAEQHTAIPVLTELYRDTPAENGEQRNILAYEIVSVYRGTRGTGRRIPLSTAEKQAYWQSVSIQEIVNDRLAEDIIKQHYGK